MACPPKTGPGPVLVFGPVSHVAYIPIARLGVHRMFRDLLESPSPRDLGAPSCTFPATGWGFIAAERHNKVLGMVFRLVYIPIARLPLRLLHRSDAGVPLHAVPDSAIHLEDERACPP